MILNAQMIRSRFKVVRKDADIDCQLKAKFLPAIINGPRLRGQKAQLVLLTSIPVPLLARDR